MQAFFFFASFMMVVSTVIGIISGVSLSSMKMIERQTTDMHRFFKDVAFMVQEHTVMQYVRVPDHSSNPSGYLQEDNILRGVNWVWGETTNDPWGNPIIVHVVYKDFPIITPVAANDNSVVNPQASGFLLVSAGPDRKIDDALQAKLDTINTGSGINDLMNVEAIQGTDDIVYAFNTKRALERRWEMVEWNLNKLAETALSKYQQEYADKEFEKTMEDFYGELLESGDLYDGTNFTIEDNLDAWKDVEQTSVSQDVKDDIAAHAPTMVALHEALTYAQASDNGFMEFLEGDSTLGFDMEVTLAKSAGSTIDDILVFTLKAHTAASGETWAWRDSSGKEVFKYVMKVGDGQ